MIKDGGGPYPKDATAEEVTDKRVFLRYDDSFHIMPYYGTGTVRTDAQGAEVLIPDPVRDDQYTMTRAQVYAIYCNLVEIDRDMERIRGFKKKDFDPVPPNEKRIIRPQAENRLSLIHI